MFFTFVEFLQILFLIVFPSLSHRFGEPSVKPWEQLSVWVQDSPLRPMARWSGWHRISCQRCSLKWLLVLAGVCPQLPHLSSHCYDSLRGICEVPTPTFSSPRGDLRSLGPTLPPSLSPAICLYESSSHLPSFSTQTSLCQQPGPSAQTPSTPPAYWWSCGFHCLSAFRCALQGSGPAVPRWLGRLWSRIKILGTSILHLGPQSDWQLSQVPPC